MSSWEHRKSGRNVDDCRLRHVLGDLWLISRDSNNHVQGLNAEMRRYKYNDSLATASIAAGGTLGILIPPSGNSGDLWPDDRNLGQPASCSLPAFCLVWLACCSICWPWLSLSPQPAAGPAGERSDWGERLLALRVWTTLGLFIFVIGGIYVGAFHTDRSSGNGRCRRHADRLAAWRAKRCISDGSAARNGSDLGEAVCAAVWCPGLFKFAQSATAPAFPAALIVFITAFDLSPMRVIFIILLIYVLLGCVFESMSMILLTVPIFAPLVEGLALI